MLELYCLYCCLFGCFPLSVKHREVSCSFCFFIELLMHCCRETFAFFDERGSGDESCLLSRFAFDELCIK